MDRNQYNLVYVDFKSLLEKIDSCNNNPEKKALIGKISPCRNEQMNKMNMMTNIKK